jgi:DNA-3-methyladenine glycosylase II
MLQKIRSHFAKTDPILHTVLEKLKHFELLTKSSDYFSDLCEVIINQQLSTKAADTIFARFKKLFPKEHITPQYLLKIPDEKIRSTGPSNSKVRFMKDLAQRVISKEILLEKLDELTDEIVMKELTKVKGIGPWTAQMFMMFTLAREDIFSYGDLGLRRAIQKLYKMKKEPAIKQMEKLSKKWVPYRTYAARILWRSLEI